MITSKRSSTEANFNFNTVLSGGIAGMVSRLVASPFDVMKIKLQMQTHSVKLKKPKSVLPDKHFGIVGMARSIIKEDGFKGFWRGNWSAEYLYIIYGATQFFTYSRTRSVLNEWGVDNDNQLSFFSGSFAGTVATIVSYPLDLLRTRFVTQAIVGEHYSSLLSAVKVINKREGIRGFYRGLVPTVIQITPAVGLMFLGYDASKRQLNHLLGYDNPWVDTLAGSFGGFFSKTLIFPMDLLRKRIQVYPSHLPPRSMWQTLTSIIKHEGALALFKGLVPGLLKTVPTTAVAFGTYGFCMRLLQS